MRTVPFMSDPDILSRREREIMDVIYRAGRATAGQVLKGMASPPSRTAVRTLLGILENKGHLQHRQQGREYVYSPTRPRKMAGRSMLRNVVGTFFDGSVEKALAAHFTDPRAQWSEEELDRIAALIETKKREQQITDGGAV